MAVEISGDTGVSKAQPTALPFLVGQVCFFAQNAVPDGFLKANGAAVSRTTYAALFTAIGTTYGVGDGSTTFNLPDFRGEFPRGFDDGRGVDSGRVFGSAQSQAFASHKHEVITEYGVPGNGSYPPGNAGTTMQLAGSSAGTKVAVTSVMNNTGGTETRPRNIAVLACIKY